MKRYSSGLYARLGFASPSTASPDIVLVDEVLSVGDAAFRRRALEALRQLIADGKTVLFISHDMWNVRRLCSEILWMEDGRVRAYGAAGEIAERYMNEVNLEALANQATVAAEPSRRHRRNPLHRGGAVTTPTARRPRCFRRATRWSCARPIAPSSAVERPVFQVAIVDVDTGVVVTTATLDAGGCAADGRGRRRRSSAGSSGCRCGRGSTCCGCRSPTRIQLASYDVVTAGPRFAVTGQGGGRRQPGRRTGRPGVAAVRVRPSRGGGGAWLSDGRRLVSVPHGARRREHAAHRHHRAGCSRRIRTLRVVIVSPLARDPEFVRGGRASARRVRGSAAAPARRPRSAAAGADAGGVSRFGHHRVGAASAAPRRSPRAPSAGLALKQAARAADCAVDGPHGDALRPERSARLASVGRGAVRSASARRCWWCRARG